jgi:hypothetical protein
MKADNSYGSFLVESKGKLFQHYSTLDPPLDGTARTWSGDTEPPPPSELDCLAS